MTTPVHQDLADKHLLPGEHLVDSGYPSAGLIIHAAHVFGITLVSPMLLDTSAQARAGAGYDKATFAIDFDRRRATCPQGVTSNSWNPCRQHRDEAIVVSWPKTACLPCPARQLCTSGRHRQISIRPRELHEALASARAEQTSAQWKARYTPPGPASRAPCARPPTSPESAGHATSDCPSPARAQHRRCRDQHDPHGRLLDRPPSGPDPIKPPRTPRLHAHSVTE